MTKGGQIQEDTRHVVSILRARRITSVFTRPMAYQLRRNFRETIRQGITLPYEPLLQTLTALEHLFINYQRGGQMEKTSCETHDSS